MRLDSVALMKIRPPIPKKKKKTRWYFNIDKFLKNQHRRDIRQRK